MRIFSWRSPPPRRPEVEPLWLEVEAQQAWESWDQGSALRWDGAPILTADGQAAACPPCAYEVIARWWLDRASGAGGVVEHQAAMRHQRRTRALVILLGACECTSPPDPPAAGGPPNPDLDVYEPRR